jgi:hypothetical protein
LDFGFGFRFGFGFGFGLCFGIGFGIVSEFHFISGLVLNCIGLTSLICLFYLYVFISFFTHLDIAVSKPVSRKLSFGSCHNASNSVGDLGMLGVDVSDLMKIGANENGATGNIKNDDIDANDNGRPDKSQPSPSLPINTDRKYPLAPSLALRFSSEVKPTPSPSSGIFYARCLTMTFSNSSESPPSMAQPSGLEDRDAIANSSENVDSGDGRLFFYISILIA